MKSLPQASLLDGKVCAQCGLWQPLVKFGARKSREDGRDPKCRNCVSPAERRKLYMQQWRADNKQHVKDYKQQYERANPDKVKATAKRMYEKHKPKILARCRQWQLENSERYKKRLRIYHAEHRDELAEKQLAYIERQKAEMGADAYYAREAAKARRYRARAYKQNPARFLARYAEWRARKFNAEGTHTAEEWLAICEHYRHACVNCGKQPETLHADHVVPLTKGGSNDIANIQPLCKSCNSRKHAKTIDYRPDGGEFARSLKQ